MPKIRTQNEILSHASGVVINGSSLVNVGRDHHQYNHCTVVHTRQTKDSKSRMNLPEISQFSEVKRGDIYKDPNGTCYSWRLCSNGKDDTEAVVYHAELNIVGPFGQKRFTVKTYRGRNAMKEWRRDFLRCSDSGDWCREIPLFGYNISSVPLLIFCGELIPLAHIQYETILSESLMRVYFDILRETLGCVLNEIWMNPMSGTFCRGPAGPKCWNRSSTLTDINIPADVNFFKEGIFIRYLINKKHDNGLLWALSHSSHYGRAKKFGSFYPKVVSRSHNTTIAFNQNVEWRSYTGSLVEGRKVIRSGLIRFRLNNDQCNLDLRSMDRSQSWLSQALSAFHAHGIWLDEDLSQYKLVYTKFILNGALERSRSKQQRRELCDPIYFFLESCPPSNMRFYFWSHHRTGKNPFSLDMCKYFGVPFKLSLQAIPIQEAWPTKIYKTMHDYQILRGFDPRTTDFAQSVCHWNWKVVLPENHFQELNEDENNLPSTSQQLLLKLNNPLQSSEGIALSDLADGKQPFSDDSHLFDGNQKIESALTPDFHPPHSFSTVLIGSSSCRVMKCAQFPKLFTSYARMFASADQRSDLELLSDLD